MGGGSRVSGWNIIKRRHQVCLCVCVGGGFLLNQPNRILAEGGLRLIHQRQELMNVIRSGK